MSFNSFYGGGRASTQSFTIVKRFDGINIPQPNEKGEYTYKQAMYALDGNTNAFIVPLIKQTATNKGSYKWKVHLHDGTPVNNSEYTFPKEYAEGMIQCFEKGSLTLTDVNYGEYVLIDTIENLSLQNDEDNGKLFRRGFDINNGFAGAEYFGNFVGPRGASGKVTISSVGDVKASSIYSEGMYNYANGGLVPGKDGDRYNDGITYFYADIKDASGAVAGCAVAFAFPYMVQEFDAEAVDEFDKDNMIEKVDDGTHPFYQKYKIKLPKGVKGDSFGGLGIIPTKGAAGIDYYNTVGGAKAGTLDTDVNIAISAQLDNGFLPVEYKGSTKYIKAVDGTEPHLRYSIINEVNNATEYIDAGLYSRLVSINMKPDQKLYIQYENGSEKAITEPLNYILETVLSEAKSDGSTAPANHLLVYYSDPARRQLLITEGKSVKYYSTIEGQVVDGWYDLGRVKGETGGLQILTNFDSTDSLYNDGVAIKPENLPGSSAEYEGYAVTVGNTDIFVYDYIKNKWNNIGSLDQSTSNPNNILICAEAKEDGTPNVSIDKLARGGMWFIQEQVTVR